MRAFNYFEFFQSSQSIPRCGELFEFRSGRFDLYTKRELRQRLPIGDPHRRRLAFTLLELLTCIGIVTILMSLLIPAVLQVRERGRMAQCLSNLHQIGLAGSPLGVVKAKYPANSEIEDGAAVVSEVRCPSDSGSATVKDPKWQDAFDGRTNYAVVGSFDGRPTAGSRNSGGEASITDGLSNTFCCGEQDSRPVDPEATWIGFSTATCERLPNARRSDGSYYIDGFRSVHSNDGANFVFCDGSARFISASIDLKIYQALATISGGEVVGDF